MSSATFHHLTITRTTPNDPEAREASGDGDVVFSLVALDGTALKINIPFTQWTYAISHLGTQVVAWVSDTTGKEVA